jgi:hypothetical protein
MADQQPNTGQSNFTQVVCLLRQAESLLSGVSNSDNTVANNTNASLRPPNSSTLAENSNVDSAPSVATTPTSSDRSLANFLSLFSGYNRGSFRQNSSRASSAPPPKRKLTLSQFVPKDTWTHDLFCLADCHQNYQPTRGQKCDLQLAGLGRKKFLKKIVVHLLLWPNSKNIFPNFRIEVASKSCAAELAIKIWLQYITTICLLCALFERGFRIRPSTGIHQTTSVLS